MSQTTELADLPFEPSSATIHQAFWRPCGHLPLEPYKTSFGRDNVPTCLVHEDVGDAKLTNARISVHLTDVSSKFMRFPTLNLHKSTPQNHEGMVASPQKMVSDVSGSFIGSVKPSQV